MNESIEKQERLLFEQMDERGHFRPKPTDADVANPVLHVLHHEMCWKDRCRYDEELEELRKENVELLRRVEKLENALWGE